MLMDEERMMIHMMPWLASHIMYVYIFIPLSLSLTFMRILFLLLLGLACLPRLSYWGVGGVVEQVVI